MHRYSHVREKSRKVKDRNSPKAKKGTRKREFIEGLWQVSRFETRRKTLSPPSRFHLPPPPPPRNPPKQSLHTPNYGNSASKARLSTLRTRLGFFLTASIDDDSGGDNLALSFFLKIEIIWPRWPSPR